MGIIGIVAAVTLPGLIQNYQKMVLKNRFKKSYSMLQQAVNKAQADLGFQPECFYWEVNPYKESDYCLHYTNGSCDSLAPLPSDWNGRFSDRVLFTNAVIKNLRVIKICEDNALRDGCIPKYKGYDTILTEQGITPEEAEKKISGCDYYAQNYIDSGNKTFVLADGTILILFFRSSIQAFAMDINGKKGPNKWGYDIFSFGLTGMPDKSIFINRGVCEFKEAGGLTVNQMIQNSYQ